MESMPLLRQLIEYDHWANCEALTSLESLGERAERLDVALDAHVTEHQGPNQPSLDPWPALALAEFRRAVDELHQRWSSVLDRLTRKRWAKILSTGILLL